MELIPFVPELPITETLEFLTDILPHLDGTEQRVNLRKCPRQKFSYTYAVENQDRQHFESILFDQQGELMQLPVWTEGLILRAPAAATDTSVNVYDPMSLPADLGYTTAFNDFRTAGSALVWSSETNYEVVDNLDLSTDGDIAFDVGLVNDYPAGAKIYPIRIVRILSDVLVSRQLVNMTQYSVTFCSTDNNIDIPDVSAFSSFNSLPLLDDPNASDGTIRESWNKNLTIIDGGTGVFTTSTLWDRSRRTTVKSFFIKTRQRTWEVRQLLHAIRGRQQPFYLPSFVGDVTPVANLVSGASTIDIIGNDYTNLVQSRSPRNVIRISLSSGTVYTRTVVSSAILTSTTERLTLNTTWPSNVNVADIVRVDFLEKVRIDSDSMTFNYLDGLGRVDVSFPVRTVFE